MRSHAPTIKQFPSRYVPPMQEAVTTAPPVKTTSSFEDVPPPLPTEATLGFNLFERPARENIHARSSEAIDRRIYGNRGRYSNRSSRNDEPRFINARFPGKCSETDAPIFTDEPILWFPLSKRVYCQSSDMYQTVNRTREQARQS